MAGSDHYIHTWCPSVPTFHIQAKQNRSSLPGVRGLAQVITDDRSCLVTFCSYFTDHKHLCPESHPFPLASGRSCCSNYKRSIYCTQTSRGQFLHYADDSKCCYANEIKDCVNEDGLNQHCLPDISTLGKYHILQSYSFLSYPRDLSNKVY